MQPRPLYPPGVQTANPMDSDGTIQNDADTLQCRGWFLFLSKEIPSFACALAGPTGGGRCTPGTPFRNISHEAYYSGQGGQLGALLGVLYLSEDRDALFRYNLIDPYLTVGEQYPNITCASGDLPYRTADGRCNNLQLPAMGMSGTRLGRNTQPVNDTNLQIPNADLIGELMKRRNNFIPSPFLNVIGSVWPQFMTTDWFGHGFDPTKSKNPSNFPYLVLISLTTKKAISVPLVGQQGSITFPATLMEEGWTINTQTHWWDGSQIYGSSRQGQSALRTFSGGKVKTANGLLVLPERTIKGEGSPGLPANQTILPITG